MIVDIYILVQAFPITGPVVLKPYQVPGTRYQYQTWNVSTPPLPKHRIPLYTVWYTAWSPCTSGYGYSMIRSWVQPCTAGNSRMIITPYVESAQRGCRSFDGYSCIWWLRFTATG